MFQVKVLNQEEFEQQAEKEIILLEKHLDLICTPNTGHPVLGVLLYEIQL